MNFYIYFWQLYATIQETVDFIGYHQSVTSLTFLWLQSLKGQGKSVCHISRSFNLKLLSRYTHQTEFCTWTTTQWLFKTSAVEGQHRSLNCLLWLFCASNIDLWCFVLKAVQQATLANANQILTFHTYIWWWKLNSRNKNSENWKWIHKMIRTELGMPDLDYFGF